MATQRDHKWLKILEKTCWNQDLNEWKKIIEKQMFESRPDRMKSNSRKMWPSDPQKVGSRSREVSIPTYPMNGFKIINKLAKSD